MLFAGGHAILGAHASGFEASRRMEDACCLVFRTRAARRVVPCGVGDACAFITAMLRM